MKNPSGLILLLFILLISYCQAQDQGSPNKETPLISDENPDGTDVSITFLPYYSSGTVKLGNQEEEIQGNLNFSITAKLPVSPDWTVSVLYNSEKYSSSLFEAKRDNIGVGITLYFH